MCYFGKFQLLYIKKIYLSVYKEDTMSHKVRNYELTHPLLFDGLKTGTIIDEKQSSGILYYQGSNQMFYPLVKLAVIDFAVVVLITG